MTQQEPRPVPGPETIAQRSADRLASALEEAGFDVGVAFPGLQGILDRTGAPVVELGRVTASDANRLAATLLVAGETHCCGNEHWS